MTTLNEQAADILDQAADEVDKGWCQHVSEDRLGNVCATGAINRAAFGHARLANISSYFDEWISERTVYLAATRELRDVFAEQYGGTVGIFYVNDVLAKSGDEISTCMRKAAINLRNTI